MIENLKSKYKICRLCGLVLKNSKISGQCPACGAPEKSFIQYELKIEEKRLKILHLDLHPISTHFSIGYMISIFIIFFLSLIREEIFGIELGHGALLDFFVFIEPLCTIFTLIVGIIDGKLRYKKLNTQFLKMKIILGILIVIDSIFILVFHRLYSTSQMSNYLLLEGIFIVIGTITTSMLGLIGSKLVGNLVPQGHIVKM
jgi:uncharacterized membrane protein